MQTFSLMVFEPVFLAGLLINPDNAMQVSIFFIALIGAVIVGLIVFFIIGTIEGKRNQDKMRQKMENHVKDMQEVKWNVSNVLTMIDLGKLQFDENEYEQLLNDDMYLSNRNNVIISIMAGLSSVPTVIVKHQDNYFVPDINIKGAQSRIAIIKEFYKNSFALPQSESPASNYGCDRLYYKDFSQDQEKVFFNSKLSFKIFTNKDS